MELSDADFNEFFNEKKRGTYTCAFCGAQHFQPLLNMQQTPGELTIPINPPPGLVQPGWHNFFGISCTNCGRTDLFHTNQITLWKLSKGKL